MQQIGTLACLALPLAAAAQQPASDIRFPHLAVEAAAGFSQPNGNASDLTNLGWTVRAGAGYKFTSRFTLFGEYEFQRFGWQSGTLPDGSSQSGNLNINGFNAQPTWRLHKGRRISLTAGFGAGFYQRLTSSSGPNSYTCDPLFGCYPTAEHLHNPSSNQVGANGALGISYRPRNTQRWSYYLEGRYLWLDTRPETAAFFPVTLGVRW